MASCRSGRCDVAWRARSSVSAGTKGAGTLTGTNVTTTLGYGTWTGVTAVLARAAAPQADRCALSTSGG